MQWRAGRLPPLRPCPMGLALRDPELCVWLKAPAGAEQAALRVNEPRGHQPSPWARPAVWARGKEVIAPGLGDNGALTGS